MLSAKMLVKRVVIIVILMLNAPSYTQEARLVIFAAMFIEFIDTIKRGAAKFAHWVPTKTQVIRIALFVVQIEVMLGVELLLASKYFLVHCTHITKRQESRSAYHRFFLLGGLLKKASILVKCKMIDTRKEDYGSVLRAF